MKVEQARENTKTWLHDNTALLNEVLDLISLEIKSTSKNGYAVKAFNDDELNDYTDLPNIFWETVCTELNLRGFKTSLHSDRIRYTPIFLTVKW